MPRDDFPYPPSPADVPDDLTALPPAYTSRQWLLIACLFVFLMVYAGVVAATGLLTVLMAVLVPRSPVLGVLGVLVFGVAFVFLVKGLFKRQRVDRDLHLEVTDRDHPKLFGFLRRVCDEVGVAEPDRVFVAPDVNAGVVFRTSLVNVVVPPKRDLVIGLGLVNALSLSEFKATLAHEFGHFAQGGWVNSYFNVVYRICYEIVVGRDWFDRTVDDLRRAGGWPSLIGHTVGGVVGAFRWCLDRAFRLITFQLHSVLREREFHADLVAASVAGSNAIVHTLYRLRFAAETFDQALADLRQAADHKLYTADLYFHHHAAGDLVRRQKKDPYRGKPPDLAGPWDGRRVQVFDPDAEPGPADDGDYHPPNHDREENVKRRFVPADDDPRSAWLLFDDPAQLRERVTYKMYRMGLKVPKGVELADPKRVQQFIDDEHAETTYDPRYEGAYDDRLIDPGDPDELADAIRKEPWDDARLAVVFARLYAGLKDKADERREVAEDLERLYRKPDGARDRRVKRKIEEAEERLVEIDRWFASLDRRAYLVHVQMAQRTSPADARELVERYRFHLAVQGIYRTARDHARKAEFHVGLLADRRDVPPHLFAEVQDVLRDARRALKKVLREADGIDLPAMKNFVAGDRLGDFLLPGKLVREPPAHVTQGEWIGQLMTQLAEVRGRATRLHFKSLGGILALQETVAAAFLAKQQATPV